MIRKFRKDKPNFGGERSDSKQPNFLGKFLNLILGFLNCLSVRLLIIFWLAMIISSGISDLLYPYIVKAQADKLVAASSASLDPKSFTNDFMDGYAIRTHASWCYVTGTGQRSAVTCHSKSLPSTLVSNPNLSQMLTIKGKHYYQAEAELNNGSNRSILHLAFPLPDDFLPKLLSGDMKQTYLPAQYVFVLYGGILLLVLMLLEAWVARPLNRIAQAAHSFVSLSNLSTFTSGGLEVPGAVTEVHRVRNELAELRHQFDELNSSRVAREAEMRRLITSHEKEKTSLVSNYKQQLASTEQKISELHTKEVEEEFATSISHELDSIRSSQQLCDRVLEKVNNKYPSTVEFGAFFKVYESLNYEMLSHLAFDAQSIQMLRKINHFSIAQKLFSSGQHLHISYKAMQEYGLAILAERNNIKHAVYIPLIFQQRNLGMFAFYIVPEAINIQEILRTLRTVCDIAARALYQLILYEEATTAARTDLLTNLPNRKFLEEIFPVILDRASASSSKKPVSVIVIHPDQLRSVAENSGRVAVDRLLKELARVLKEHISSSTAMQEHETYLIRFATEDFVLILDQVDLAFANRIAEQIKETVESKSSWPGGLASITVSQGISSYPDDGTTPNDLINMAEAALLYGKDIASPGSILQARTVPEEYRSSKSVAIDGNLSVFDAGGLLQSMANSLKTGVLTVESSNGKELWTLFENGKPAQSRLGKLKSDQALVEFIVTFEDGVFNFQETSGQVNKLPKLDDSYNIKTTLDRIVMDGALAQDNFRAARKYITTLETFMKPASDLSVRFEKLKELEDPPTQKEYEVIEEIIKQADGQKTLEQIFKQLDTIPTHQLWMCLATMLRQEMLVQCDTPKAALSKPA